MASANVELVRGAFAHFIARGEPDWALLHEEIETYDHDVMDAGDYRGHAGHRRWLEEWASAWSEFTLEPPHELIDAGADVILVYRLKATGLSSGVTVERDDALVCHVEDALITRLDYYNSREQALTQVGLAPEGGAVDRRDETTSQEIENFIRSAYDRFNNGERMPSTDAWHPDGVYVTSSEDPDPGTHTGLDAIANQVQTWVEAYPDLRVDPIEILINGDRAVVWARWSGHGAGSGVPIEMEMAQVVTIEDGKIRRIEEYMVRAEALDAAGLALDSRD